MTSATTMGLSLKTRVTLTTLMTFVVSLWSLSFYASEMLRNDMERMLGDQQYSTVSYLAAELNHELEDRMDALSAVAESASAARVEDAVRMQAFLDGLPLLRRLFNGGVIAYRRDGTPLAEVSSSAAGSGEPSLEPATLAVVLSKGTARFGRPAMDRNTRVPMFSMIVPIRDAQDRVVGALAGVTNLADANFLDMITKTGYGKTGGFMLVAPLDRMLLAASDPRHFSQALPAPDQNALVDGFMNGYEGSRVGVNPYGVEVLASAKGIPAPGWYAAVALPTAEAFAPVYAMQQRMLAATVLLTVLAGALTWWLLKRLLAPMQTTARTLTELSQSPHSPEPLPIARLDEIGQLIGAFNRLLEALAQREETLRIAAIAFECQEGMIITDANLVILRTNRSFSRIMGYSSEEVIGETTKFMRSDRHPPEFYEAAWATGRGKGAWQGEVWHKRKNGEVFPQWLTCTAVKNDGGDVTHFVVTHTDITFMKKKETERLQNEAAHRMALVREVHHRIKNNLQGIIGLLRQSAQAHPETEEPMNRAIGQVQGISVIYGLQGRTVASSVRLCELTAAIAEEIQNLWQTPITVDIPHGWTPCVIADDEAVPIALVLNELAVNAVKHGGKAHGSVGVRMRKGLQADIVQITITNGGYLEPMKSEKNHSGLQLITALMPRHGARIDRRQDGDRVVTLLELASPVICLERESQHE